MDPQYIVVLLNLINVHESQLYAMLGVSQSTVVCIRYHLIITIRGNIDGGRNYLA